MAPLIRSKALRSAASRASTSASIFLPASNSASSAFSRPSNWSLMMPLPDFLQGGPARFPADGRQLRYVGPHCFDFPIKPLRRIFLVACGDGERAVFDARGCERGYMAVGVGERRKKNRSAHFVRQRFEVVGQLDGRRAFPKLAFSAVVDGSLRAFEGRMRQIPIFRIEGMVDQETLGPPGAGVKKVAVAAVEDEPDRIVGVFDFS